MLDVFDWDDGNWPKCGKHGLTQAEIEAVFQSGAQAYIDPSTDETRFRIVGPTKEGRIAFVVFTIRERGDKSFIRPISARYMHGKEVRRYEHTRAKAVPDIQD